MAELLMRTPTIGLAIHNLKDVVPKDPEWIWPGRIPLKLVSLITGDPGIGKTHALISLACTFAEGGSWPDGTPVVPGRVLYVDAENGLEEIRRRMDVQGFEDWDSFRVALMEDFSRTERVPFHEQFVDYLQDAIKRFRPRWVIIDPLVAFHSRNENSATDVRELMATLGNLATKHELAITVVQHPRKAGDSLDPHSIRGSGDFVAAARSVLTVTLAREPGIKALAVTKLNIGPIPPHQGFRLIDREVQWVGQVELPTKHATKEGAAKEIIQESLNLTPMVARVIYAMADEEGIGSGTVDSAARALGVIRFKGADRAFMWKLPDTLHGRSQKVQRRRRSRPKLRSGPFNLPKNPEEKRR